MNTKQILLTFAAGFAVVAVVIGGFFLVSLIISNTGQTQTEPLIQSGTSERTDAIVGWKIYTNHELGITFKYPSEWRNVRSEREHVCDGPFGGEDAIRESMETGDPCVAISVGVDFTDYNYRRDHSEDIAPRVIFSSFLYSVTPMFIRYQPPRGGGMSMGKDVKLYGFFTDFSKNKCDNDQFRSNCKVFTNSNGVRVAKYYEESPRGMGSIQGWRYYIKSPHPFFSALVFVSSGAYEDPKHKEFELLIDSLKFIK